jgi:predicted NACHT family NTPase
VEINLITLIKGIASFATPLAKDQINRNEAVIQLKKRFKLDFEHLPDEFGIVYAYTLVEYGLGKQEPILELFRQEEIKEAFHRAFVENNLSILQKEGEDFLDWNILGDKIRELGINPRREFAAFSVVFHEIVPRTRRPSQVMQDRQLQEILEHLPQLNTLDEIRALLVQLLQSYQSRPDDLKQQSVNALDPRLEETVRLYLTKCFSEDRFAELDQAGETDPERRTPLKQVFIDLDVRSRQGSKPRGLRLENLPQSARRLSFDDTPFDVEEHDSLSAMDCLLKECCSKVVIIGGPGQGKSTLGQQLAQVHRAKLLNKPYDFQPQIKRIPFRVVLKYFAQWLADKADLENDDLEAYLAERVGKLAARPESVITQHIQEILRCRPCVLILDGLDEVVATELQKRMLARIQDFMERAEILGANLMVVATSRPNIYENQFEPELFWHLELQRLSKDKVHTYAEKWVQAKNLSEEEQKRILPILEECQQDGNISALLTTPLQVTIILLIIKDGGRPPAQREALFNEYWSTIFRREKSKAKEIIQSDETILFDLHAYLGYLLHRRASEQNVQSLLPEAEFSQAVREFLRKEDKRSSEEAINSKMKLLVRDAQERLVLIVAPQPGLFGFELRSFQEFFAAVHLAQTATAG